MLGFLGETLYITFFEISFHEEWTHLFYKVGTVV